MDTTEKKIEGNSSATSSDNAGNVSATASESQAKVIADLQARLEKETKDKEIYRSGLLAAKDLSRKSKRITQEDIESPEKLDEVIDAKIQERDLETKATQEVEQKLQESEKLRVENEELRRTLEAGRSAGGSYGSASIGSGHNESSESKPQGYWSEAQKSELRQIYNTRGMYTPAQIDKMIAKAEEIAKGGTAQSERGNDIVKTRSY